MPSDPYGPNVIEVSGMAMLLTTTRGGVKVHLTPVVGAQDTGREAVPDFYFTSGPDEEGDTVAGYDRAALTEARWSPTTLCGREWAIMVGGDGGAVGRHGEVSFAPTCRRCLTLIDRYFPKSTPDARLDLVAELAADAVITHRGFAEIHGVPGDQQDELRRKVRTLIRRRTGHSARTYSADGILFVECEAIYRRLADQGDREAAEAIRAAFAGEPLPRRERDWVISWGTWGIA
jgi:hypothetical protein